MNIIFWPTTQEWQSVHPIDVCIGEGTVWCAYVLEKHVGSRSNAFDHDMRKMTCDAPSFLFAHVLCLDLQDWENPLEMKPHARKATLLLEDAIARDPANPWAIHLFTQLMEAAAEAEAAVAPAKKLQYLVPLAPHSGAVH